MRGRSGSVGERPEWRQSSDEEPTKTTTPTGRRIAATLRGPSPAFRRWRSLFVSREEREKSALDAHERGDKEGKEEERRIA